MSGVDVATSAPVDDSRTVAPAVLQQRAPAVRYIDPSQSNVIMESGTKSASVSAMSFSCKADTLEGLCLTLKCRHDRKDCFTLKS